MERVRKLEDLVSKYEEALRDIAELSTVEDNLADAQYLACLALELEDI